MSVPRALTIATSDSGGGAGIQADLKAFAAAGCHGMSVLVALTAQSTIAVTAVHELPPDFVTAELEAVFGDIGVDAAKTGMLFSRRLIETVADYLEEHPVPLVVDPVMVASSGAKLLEDDAVDTLVARLFPLATVVPPSSPAATASTRSTISSTAPTTSRSPSATSTEPTRTAPAAPTRPPSRRYLRGTRACSRPPASPRWPRRSRSGTRSRSSAPAKAPSTCST